MSALSAPRLDRLPATDDEGRHRAVIEACQGSRNKLKYQPALQAFELHAVLPLGTSFPYDFGFIPSTRGDDGDPLDVLVLMDEGVAAGTVVPCRLVGVIEAEQLEKDAKKPTRNDRLLAVAASSHRYGRCRRLGDLAPEVLDEIERFFVFYNRQRGVDFRPLGRGGVARARQLVEAGRKAFA
jgi:inorganic pyrophosphatase